MPQCTDNNVKDNTAAAATAATTATTATATATATTTSCREARLLPHTGGQVLVRIYELALGWHTLTVRHGRRA